MKTKQMVAATVGAVMAAGMMVTALAAAPGRGGTWSRRRIPSRPWTAPVRGPR